MTYARIIGTMTELCRVLNNEEITISSMKPTKGIDHEDLIIVAYQYKNEEDE